MTCLGCQCPQGRLVGPYMYLPQQPFQVLDGIHRIQFPIEVTRINRVIHVRSLSPIVRTCPTAYGYLAAGATERPSLDPDCHRVDTPQSAALSDSQSSMLPGDPTRNAREDSCSPLRDHLKIQSS